MKSNNFPHFIVLSTLAGLTLMFLGAAALSLWGEPEILDGDRSLKNRSSQGRNLPAIIEFSLNQSGIVGIDAADLEQLNFRFHTLSTDHINLTRFGKPVPFFVDEQNGSLYFYTPPAESDLEETAVYRLGLEPGLPMTERDAAPTERGDITGIYQFYWEEHSPILAQANSKDAWLGHLLLAPRTWELTLDSLRSEGGPGELQIDFYSNTEDTPDPDHHVDVLLNDQHITSWFWDGIRHEQLSAPIPAGMLVPGEFNTLTLSAPGDTGAVGESIYINTIRINYEREIQLWREQLNFFSSSDNIQIRLVENEPLIFDITNPSQPIALTNFRFENEQVNFSGSGSDSQYLALEPWQAIKPVLRVVPQWKSPLRAANRSADFIAIVADVDGFIEAMQPLLQHRGTQGYRVTAVSLSQIYDEFGSGEPSPVAIQSFLAYAAANWKAPAPRFVLLVGDASYDVRNLTGGKNNNLLPTYLYTSTGNQYMVSDTWLIDFDQDNVPEMAVGRFPAQTPAQLRSMVAKTIAYETETAVWQQRILFVADNETKFETLSHELADNLAHTDLAVHQLDITAGESAHYDIISAFSNGAGIINYSGPGRLQYWGDATTFHGRDAGMLVDSGRFPVLTTFTCNNGAFGEPDADSLAESLLWAEDGGIVAAISASGSTDITAQTEFANVFYAKLFATEITLGEALMQTQTAVSSDPAMRDAIHAFQLLGDPALQIKRP